jgi:membrane protein DedA with SNARE-associated domain
MAEWIANIMNQLGYWGIGLLMFLENLFPPIPSELIMPLAGFTVAQGRMDMAPAITAGVVGTVLGALPWYYAGSLMGETRLKQWCDRYGKWIGISGEDIHNASGWFDKHGYKTVLFCRLVPGVRTLISIPAGIHRMSLVPFLIYSTIGTLLWTVFLTYAGFLLGNNYGLVEEYLGPVSKIVLGVLLVAFVVWLVLHQRQRKKVASEAPSPVASEESDHE